MAKEKVNPKDKLGTKTELRSLVRSGGKVERRTGSTVKTTKKTKD